MEKISDFANRQRGALPAAAVLVIIILIAAVGFYVAKDGGSKGSGEKLAANDVLLTMVDRSLDAKTSKINGYIEVHIADGSAGSDPAMPGSSFDGRAIITAESDINDISNQKAKFNVVFEQTSPNDLEFEKAITAFDADVVGVGEIIFFRVNKLPEIVSMIMPALLDLQGEWYEIDPEDVAEQLSSGLGEEDAMALQATMGSKQLSEAQILELTEIVKDNYPFSLLQELPSEKIDGQEMYHFELVLHEDNAVALATEMATYMDEEGLLTIPEGEQFDSAELEADLKQGLREADIDFTKYPFEMWIGKDDFQIHKFYFDLDLSEIPGEELEGSIEMLFTGSDFNKPVSIEAPTEATPFTELVDQFLPMFMGPSF